MRASLFVLIPTLWVLAAAQSANSTSTKPSEQNSSTIDVLPKITPFQIPVDVLSGLGLPLEIPSVEHSAQKAGGRPSMGGLAGFAGTPAPPSFQGARGGKVGAPPPNYGTFGVQGGLPYELC
jgi:hypothetical protein